MVFQLIENILATGAITIKLAKTYQLPGERRGKNRIFVDAGSGADLNERKCFLAIIVV